MKSLVVFLVSLCVAGTVHGDCPRPTVGEHMDLITDVQFPAPEGTSVTFTCQVGYRPVGSGTVYCSNGQWSGLKMKCEPKNCGSAGEVINGQIDYSEGTEFGAIVSVICNDGYNMVGTENRLYCGARGSWEGRLPRCEVTICEPPNQIPNGYFSPEKDDYQHSEVVTYACVGQHVLNGSRTVVCSDNGTFMPAPPKCVLVECPEPQINSGIVVTGSRPPYKHKSSVTFRCNVGHNMVGSATVSCDINNKWGPALPKCDPIECKAPEITYGEVVGGSASSYKFLETVTLKCSEGYKLTGQSMLTCGERNQWSGTIPKCLLIQCTPPKVEGGVLVGDPRPSYNYKDSVVFECNSGHTMKGESTLSCDQNSQWSPKLPECTMIQCTPPKVEGGVLVGDPRPSYKYKDSVVFECNSGHTMKGESTLSCDQNSQWSPKLPECTIIECKTPEVDHGRLVVGLRTTYKYLDSVSFECKSGYKMNGTSTLTCALNSRWSPELPQCTREPVNGGPHVKIWVIVLAVLASLLFIGCCICFIYFGLLKKKKGSRNSYCAAPKGAETVEL